MEPGGGEQIVKGVARHFTYANVMSTVAVFLPVIFLEGQAGQLFRDISIALVCAVLLSLVVSVTVSPSAVRLARGIPGRR